MIIINNLLLLHLQVEILRMRTMPQVIMRPFMRSLTQQRMNTSSGLMTKILRTPLILMIQMRLIRDWDHRWILVNVLVILEKRVTFFFSLVTYYIFYSVIHIIAMGYHYIVYIWFNFLVPVLEQSVKYIRELMEKIWLMPNNQNIFFNGTTIACNQS